MRNVVYVVQCAIACLMQSHQSQSYKFSFLILFSFSICKCISLLQVFDINYLAAGDISSQKYRSNHVVGHSSLIYANTKNGVLLVAGGTRGHIRCWKEGHPNKPMWVVKRCEHEVRALAWVSQRCSNATCSEELSRMEKVEKQVIVLNSKSGLMGLKRKRPNDNQPSSSSNKGEENRKPDNFPPPNQTIKSSSLSSSSSSTSTSSTTTRSVLVASLSDGSISIWDASTIKVRFLGSSPTPSLLATLSTRDLFQPLVSTPFGWQASVSRLTVSEESPFHLIVSLTNGWRASFYLTEDGPSTCLVPLPGLGLLTNFTPPDNSGRIQHNHSVLKCTSSSGAHAHALINPCFINGELCLTAEVNSKRSMSVSSVSTFALVPRSEEECSRVAVEPNPTSPHAVMLVNNKVAAVVVTC
jgi:hypothetical protein